MRGQIAVKNYAVDKDGYITVRGQRVLGGSKMPVKFRDTCTAHCQYCRQLNIVCKLSVFMRYECAFSAPFYWNSIAGNIPRYCDNCTQHLS